MNVKELGNAMDIVKKVNEALLKVDDVQLIRPTNITDCVLSLDVEEGLEEDLDIFNVNSLKDNDVLATIMKYNKEMDMRRLVLYCYYKINSIPDYVIESDKSISELLEELKALAKSYIPENIDIVMYDGIIINKQGKYAVNVISSKKELYGVDFQDRGLKIDEYYEEIIASIEPEDIKVLFKDSNLANHVEAYLRYNSYIDIGVSIDKMLQAEMAQSREYINSMDFFHAFTKYKKEIFNRPEIRAKIDEDNLYAVAGYRYINRLETCIELEEKGVANALPTIMSMHGTQRVLDAIAENINEKKVSVKIRQEETGKEKSFKISDFGEECEDTFDILGNFYIQKHPIQAYNPQIMSLLRRESAMGILDSVEYKDEYFFLMYQMGLVSFNEMLDYEISLNPEDRVKISHDYRLKALLVKLTDTNIITEKIAGLLNDVREQSEDSSVQTDEENSLLLSEEECEEEENIENRSILDDLQIPEIFFRITLEDESLYEMLDEDFKQTFAFRSMDEIKQKGEYSTQARRNLKVLAKKGDLTQELIRSLYIYCDASIEDLEEILKKEDFDQIYNAEELAIVYQEAREYKGKDDLSDEDKEQLFIFEGQYKLQVELFKRYGFLDDEDRQIEVLDFFEDLINNRDVLKDLYLDGIISVDNLYGLDNELAIELYENGLLKNADKRYIVLNTDVGVNSGDLIRLADDGIITSRQALDLYMDGRCSLEALKAYSDGINPDEIFKEDELLAKIKQFAVIKRDNVIKDYQRYMMAYMQIKGRFGEELKAKAYKAIGGKNARSSDIIDLYSKGIIDMRLIDAPSDKLLIEMIRQGVLKADDEEFLFRDTEADGKKYLRLAKILPSLNEDQKINLLASVYSTMDAISAPRINYLSTYLDDATAERPDYDNKVNRIKRNQAGENSNKASSTKTRNLFAFGEKFKTFRGIDPNYEHEVASGSYIINFRKFNMVVLEEIYRTISDGVNSFDTQHATYIIEGTPEVYEYMGLDKDNDLYSELLDVLLRPNSRGRNYVDWFKVTQMHRDKVAGTTKCLHTTEERWQKKLREKMRLEDSNKKAQIEACLKNIEDTQKLKDSEVEEER